MAKHAICIYYSHSHIVPVVAKREDREVGRGDVAQLWGEGAPQVIAAEVEESEMIVQVPEL